MSFAISRAAWDGLDDLVRDRIPRIRRYPCRTFAYSLNQKPTATTTENQLFVVTSNV